MTCKEFERLSDKELFHEPEMKPEYEDLDESVQDKLTQEELEKYYQNPQQEKEFEENIHKEKGAHLKQCKDENCIRLLGVWRGEETLRKYVEDETK